MPRCCYYLWLFVQLLIYNTPNDVILQELNSICKSIYEKKTTMNNNEKKEPEVIIYLDRSSDARKFSESEVINFEALDKAKNFISSRINANTSLGKALSINRKFEEESNPRVNNTIAILGGRGSGKTSFIQSLKAYCDENDSSMLALEIIDPTLVETKEDILLHVISLLDTFVEEQICNLTNYSNDIVRNQEKRAWRELLNKLAKGLCSIDGIDSKIVADWNDDAYVLQKGMSDVSAARDLFANLNLLVGRVLDLVGKKVLVVFFDDIDIDISKAWKVLEVVRKYLSSHKIITIISGDEKLLSLAVRKAHWKNFGKDFLESEENQKEVLEGVRQSVEEQYFQKIIKPEYRIPLLTINNLLTRSPNIAISVRNSISDGKNGSLIQTIYKKLLRLVGINKPRDMEDCLCLLLNLPLRSQIQLLKAIPNDSLKDFDWKYPLLESLKSVFYIALLQSSIDADSLSSTPNFLVSRILKYLSGTNPTMLHNYYQLQPISLSEKQNQTLFLLSCEFSLVSRNHPYLFIDYMLRIAYVRNSLNDAEKLPQFLLEDRDMRDLIGYYIAETETAFGNIKIYAFDEKSKKSEKRGIDTIFAEESAIFKILAYLPLCSIRDVGKQNSTNFYSLPYLIGFLYDILRAEDNDLSFILKRAKQNKTYSSVAVFSGDDNEEEIDYGIISNDNIGDNSEEYEGFLLELSKWKTNYKTAGNIALNPLLLGRIITRYSNAASMYKTDTTLGIAFAHHIVMFLNSVLVEEYLWGFSKTTSELNLSNPSNANSIFIYNLGRISENYNFSLLSENQGKSYPLLQDNLKNYNYFPYLFTFFASCPLLQIYLQQAEMERIRNLFPISDKLMVINTKFSEKANTVYTSGYAKLTLNFPRFSAANSSISNTILELKRLEVSKEWVLSSSYIDFVNRLGSSFVTGIKEKSFTTLKEKLLNGSVTW